MTAARTAKRITAWVAGLIVVAMAGLFVASLMGLNLFKTSQSETALLNSIQDTSKYVAAVGNFEVVVEDKDDNPFLPDVIAGRKTVFVGAGSIDAYVDLSGLAEDDLTLSADGSSITVRLPEAQLGTPNLDHERTRLVSQDRGVLDKVNDFLNVSQQEEFYQQAEKQMTEAAEKSELKKRATENTKAMLTGMFSSTGIQATFRE